MDSGVENLRARVQELRRLPEAVLMKERELREMRADNVEVSGDMEVANMEWLRERQDAETHLLAYRDRARELKVRLQQLEAGGPESECPTCDRLLAERFQTVLTVLREEWESVVQDGSWWKRRREQLDFKPSHLQDLEGRGDPTAGSNRGVCRRGGAPACAPTGVGRCRGHLGRRPGGRHVEGPA